MQVLLGRKNTVLQVLQSIFSVMILLLCIFFLGGSFLPPPVCSNLLTPVQYCMEIRMFGNIFWIRIVCWGRFAGDSGGDFWRMFGDLLEGF